MKTEPAMLSHQNAGGTTTRFRRSVAHHCTKKREVNSPLPSQPSAFQKSQRTPRNVPSAATEARFQSIGRPVNLQAAAADKPGCGVKAAATGLIEEPADT